ncbi:mannose-1-phosphate guanylyltransferase [Bellilinea sp.]|jgi:mannose-1-phosphate guanylyltransferase|uniref:mannose-1-phosphate guanylyltransferase n=1 Tax=Bellilinea sp. TaxID=2838785 RepID=UPI002ADE5EF6|nr:sugar phosphate nucleotidyltransferase [Bellilinea sp.]
MMNKSFYAVIMAGGGGTRLWPLSRSARPKQMLKLGSDRTLFQLAVDRLYGLIPPERILVVTGAEMAFDLQKDCPEIPSENFLIEPAPKGTAAVVGLAAAFLYQKDQQAVMAVLTADHIIQDVAYFQKILQVADEAARLGYLVTLGIHPSHPSTGYGYIQRGQTVAEINQQRVYQVLKFKEKPDAETARKMVESGDHDWNSGMFFWQVDQIRREIKNQLPELYKVMLQIEKSGFDKKEDWLPLWMGLKPETIDYGIMEHARQVVVIPAAGLGWNDVGSWDSLFEVLEGDEDGNIRLTSQWLALDSQKTLVLCEDDRRLIATIGVENLIIVDSGNVLLVCHKDKAQSVREIVQILKQSGRENYL